MANIGNSPSDLIECPHLQRSHGRSSFQDKGLDYIREHRWRTVGNGVGKIADAFGWLPSPRHSFWPNLVQSLSYGSLMILGLWGMWAGRSHWREYSIFYTQFVSFASVAAVFFGATSYRAYLDVYWIVFAAGVLAALRSKSFQSRSAPDDVAPYSEGRRTKVARPRLSTPAAANRSRKEGSRSDDRSPKEISNWGVVCRNRR